MNVSKWVARKRGAVRDKILVSIAGEELEHLARLEKRVRRLETENQKLQKEKERLEDKLKQGLKEIRREVDYKFLKTLPREEYERFVVEWYERRTGSRLDLAHPKTLNEKIQWLKLYDNTPLKSQLADKYRVRGWVAERIGEEHLVPLLGVWNRFEEIDFGRLPDKFVLKATHGSGWNVIVRDKATFDEPRAARQFREWMTLEYCYCFGLELHYKGIEPRIVAEKYLETVGEIWDYKVLCTDGKPRLIWVDSDRTTEHKRNVYDLDWNQIPLRVRYPNNPTLEPRPRNLDKMVAFAERLSSGFPLLRVDFYEVGGALYFGELTFTSGGGQEPLDPPEWGSRLGDSVTLPTTKQPFP